MKKLTAWILSAAMIFGLTACTAPTAVNGSKNTAAEMTETAAETKTFLLAAAQTPETVTKVSSSDPRYLAPDGVWLADLYDEDQAAWMAYYQAQRTAAEGLPETLLPFYQAAVPAILGKADGENRVLSPVNLYLALAMLTECAENTTKNELLTLLGTSDDDDLRDTAKRLYQANFVDNGELSTRLYNSLWLKSGLDCEADTLKRLAEDHRADIFEGDPADEDYVQALRDWLNAHTDEELSEQVKTVDMDPAMLMTLVSTIVFRGKWQYPFSEDLTEKAAFHGTSGDTEADFMHRTTDDSYFYYDHFGAIRLMLSGNDYMWLILPDEGYTPEMIAAEPEFTALLSGTGFEYEGQHSKYCEIRMTVPKFDIVSDLELNETLRSLGVEAAFDPAGADFSGLFPAAPEGTALSKVRHAARVTVDEEGVTATAFTLEELCGAAMPDGSVDFVLDRPFLFGITSYTGGLLFTGIVNTVE